MNFDTYAPGRGLAAKLSGELSGKLSAMKRCMARVGGYALLLMLLLMLLLIVALPAAADLMIFPTRVVFEGRTRTAQLDLVNTGERPATYRIGFTQRRMNEWGKLGAIDAAQPGEQFADPMIRYSPRQVVLQPGAGQTVRLLLRKPPELADGEYRSHLVFERVPDAPTVTQAGDAGDSGDSIDISRTALVSVSVPVIVRHGATAAEVVISAPRVLVDAGDGKPAISFDVRRTGNRSVYGDLTAFYTAPGEKEQIVGQANGVAVYAPYPLRHVRLALRPGAPLPRHEGRLRVEFRARPEDHRVLLGSAEAER